MTNTAAGLKIDRVPTDLLVEHPENARRGDVPVIAESIEAHGVYKPLIIQRSTNRVLAGNHTLQAVRQLGHPEVDVVYLDVDDDGARRILLADNRTGDMAGYDDAALADLLRTLDGDYVGTGYAEDDALAILAAADGNDGIEEPVDDAYSAQFGVIVVSGSEAEQQEVYAQLRALFPETIEVRVVTT